MKILKQADVIIGMVATVFGVAIVVLSLQMQTIRDTSVGPGTFPGITGIVIILCGIAIGSGAVLKSVRKTKDENAGVSSKQDLMESVEHTEVPTEDLSAVDEAEHRASSIKMPILLSLGIVLYSIASLTVGLTLPTALLFLFSARYIGRFSWPKSAIACLVGAASYYVIFRMLIPISLPFDLIP